LEGFKNEQTINHHGNPCACLGIHIYRGICPSGQHIPSVEELNEYGSYECLRNQPGGSGYSGGSFDGAGYSGYWWSASEYRSYSAYDWYMSYYYESGPPQLRR
jgi:hypothetical protein